MAGTVRSLDLQNVFIVIDIRGHRSVYFALIKAAFDMTELPTT